MFAMADPGRAGPSTMGIRAAGTITTIMRENTEAQEWNSGDQNRQGSSGQSKR